MLQKEWQRQIECAIKYHSNMQRFFSSLTLWTEEARILNRLWRANPRVHVWVLDYKKTFLYSETFRMVPMPTQFSTQYLTGALSTGLKRPWLEGNIELRVKEAILILPPPHAPSLPASNGTDFYLLLTRNIFVYSSHFLVSHNKLMSRNIFCFRIVSIEEFHFNCSKRNINIV